MGSSTHTSPSGEIPNCKVGSRGIKTAVRRVPPLNLFSRDRSHWLLTSHHMHISVPAQRSQLRIHPEESIGWRDWFKRKRPKGELYWVWLSSCSGLGWSGESCPWAQSDADPEGRVSLQSGISGNCVPVISDRKSAVGQEYNFQKWRTWVTDNSIIYWVSNMSHTLFAWSHFVLKIILQTCYHFHLKVEKVEVQRNLLRFIYLRFSAVLVSDSEHITSLPASFPSSFPLALPPFLSPLHRAALPLVLACQEKTFRRHLSTPWLPGTQETKCKIPGVPGLNAQAQITSPASPHLMGTCIFESSCGHQTKFFITHKRELTYLFTISGLSTYHSLYQDVLVE